MSYNEEGREVEYMAITAKELAAKLGISEAAVSLALNEKPGVSRETRKRVLMQQKLTDMILPEKKLPSPERRGQSVLQFTEKAVLLWEIRLFLLN